ncbi:MAG: hypothetical protein WAU43_19435, partial [Acidobacteriaceae bacterium]
HSRCSEGDNFVEIVSTSLNVESRRSAIFCPGVGVQWKGCLAREISSWGFFDILKEARQPARENSGPNFGGRQGGAERFTTGYNLRLEEGASSGRA